MARWKRLMLLALPASLLSVPMARADTSSSSTGITRDDQREERFYNFDNGRQSGRGVQGSFRPDPPAPERPEFAARHRTNR